MNLSAVIYHLDKSGDEYVELDNTTYKHTKMLLGDYCECNEYNVIGTDKIQITNSLDPSFCWYYH